jgi:hypothetical protein
MAVDIAPFGSPFFTTRPNVLAYFKGLTSDSLPPDLPITRPIVIPFFEAPTLDFLNDAIK